MLLLWLNIRIANIIITIIDTSLSLGWVSDLSSETDSLPSSDRSCADGSAMNEWMDYYYHYYLVLRDSSPGLR